MTVRFALETQVKVTDAKRICAAAQPTKDLPDIDISGEIDIHARDVSVHSWGCDTEPDDARVAALCECVLEQLPAELRLAVPQEVRNEDLVPYEGMLSLRL
jgi:hypothetical protein